MYFKNYNFKLSSFLPPFLTLLTMNYNITNKTFHLQLNLFLKLQKKSNKFSLPSGEKSLLLRYFVYSGCKSYIVQCSVSLLYLQFTFGSSTATLLLISAWVTYQKEICSAAMKDKVQNCTMEISLTLEHIFSFI